jgi:hypothetical protein
VRGPNARGLSDDWAIREMAIQILEFVVEDVEDR